MSPRPKKRRCGTNQALLGFSPFARSLSRCTAAPKYPQNIAATSDSLAKNDDHSDEEEEEVLEEHIMVQADFEFFDPKPSDFHGVKILLRTYLDDTEWDLSGFVDLILGQKTVGTVVKIGGGDGSDDDGDNEDDDGLFSVVTALNFSRYKEQRCIKDVKEFLLKVCHDKDLKSQLKSLLEEQVSDVGLLVSQRVVNLPPQLLPPLYDALFDEVSWATEDEPTQELRDSFRFKFYLIVTTIYMNKHAGRQKGALKGNADEPIIYNKEEDEIFHKLCLWSFTFPLHTQPLATNESRNYKQMGLIMVIKAENVSAFREELKSLLSEL
ncbi:hypothetical protein QJS10_CPA10g01360 [Acorus calamus]|uniref:Protein BCCIP homolog n=1 Tax=Acorus calamus TaxID=4465 RepID=A0AAV9DXA8_ACOCL|nr:hypothetical protein QJS10_CPA10g01360 [Acorus calamus]